MKKIFFVVLMLCFMCPSETLLAQNSSSNSTNSTQQNKSPRIYRRSSVYTLLGYLHLFPSELGAFEAEPSDVIRRINEGEQYGYNTWRIPTEEEITIIKANGYADPNEKYMTQENRRGRVLLVTDQEKAEVINKREAERQKRESEARAHREYQEKQKRIAEAQRLKDEEVQRRIESICAQEGFVDLGLESGTLWSPKSEPSAYTFSMANMLYPRCIPSKDQWHELYKNCKWEKTDKGYIVTGKNNNSIFIQGGNYNSSTIDEANINREWIFRGGRDRAVALQNRSYWNKNILVKQGPNNPVILAVEDELYRDLGLPSGTKWADRDANLNYKCKHHDYSDELKGIPTKEQWQELKKYCTWELKDYGYKVTGPNGNYIFLSLELQGEPYSYEENKKLCMQYAYRSDKYVYRVSINERKRIQFDRRYSNWIYKQYVCLRRVQ